MGSLLVVKYSVYTVLLTTMKLITRNIIWNHNLHLQLIPSRLFSPINSCTYHPSCVPNSFETILWTTMPFIHVFNHITFLVAGFMKRWLKQYEGGEVIETGEGKNTTSVCWCCWLICTKVHAPTLLSFCCRRKSSPFILLHHHVSFGSLYPLNAVLLHAAKFTLQI